MVTLSVPGRSVLTLLLAEIVVVPTVTWITDVGLLRTPVNEIRRTVGTCVPVPLLEVTPKGSFEHTAGFVALQTTARPSGPFVLVKMSGCALTIVTPLRITVPLLLITSG